MAPTGYGDRVEGLHATKAALRAGRVRRLFIERRRADAPDIAALVEAASPDQVTWVDEIAELAQTESPQGLIAECIPIAAVALDDLAGEGAALIVADHLQDPHNVGAIARSTVAAGMTGLVVAARRSAPLSAVAFKTAAGALETLPVAIVASIPEALRRLGDRGVWSVGLQAGSPTSLFGLDLLTERVAVVIGSEGQGLSRLVVERCDAVASIPMAGDVESLNASVSAALAAFEIMRVRQLPG